MALINRDLIKRLSCSSIIFISETKYGNELILRTTGKYKKDLYNMIESNSNMP